MLMNRIFIILLLFSSTVFAKNSKIPKEFKVYQFNESSMYPYLGVTDKILMDSSNKKLCLDCKDGIKRGDVIVYINPNKESKKEISRVIGLPGDKITLTGDFVKINSKKEKFQKFVFKNQKEVSKELKIFGSKTGDQLYIVALKDKNPSKKIEEYKVETGEVFVIGDNRSESIRDKSFGKIALPLILGKEASISKKVLFRRLVKRIKKENSK